LDGRHFVHCLDILYLSGEDGSLDWTASSENERSTLTESPTVNVDGTAIFALGE
jgi:hypothetical protein